MSRRHARSKPPSAVEKLASPAPSRTSPVGAADAARSVGDGEAIRITHWFDSASAGPPYAATVRFRGRLVSSSGPANGRREFVQDEAIDGVVPDSGPISITSDIYNLAAGDWTVTAELLPATSRLGKPQAHGRQGAARTLPRATWSWRRWAVSSAGFTPIRTRWAPLVRLGAAPAVIPGTWSGLVLLGTAAGLALQATLLAGEGVPALATLLLTVVALLAGLLGAKAWYIAMHPRTWRAAPGEGWAVDGFLVVLPIVVISGLLLLDMPIGLFVDASTPALFLGVAIGRVGCFLTGCCAGRCTRSRWGIWSSDRRVGARRIPTQLLESIVGLALSASTLLIFLAARPPVDGLIFVGALGVYTVARRFLLRLRAARQPASSTTSSTRVKPGPSAA